MEILAWVIIGGLFAGLLAWRLLLFYTDKDGN